MVPREVEMAKTAKVVEMVNSVGIKVGEEISAMMVEEEDRMVEVVADTEEAVAEDHGVDNHVEITVGGVETMVVVVATS